MSRLIRVASSAILVSLVMSAPGAVMAAGEPEIVSIEIGFNRVCKVGRWTPIEIELKGGAAPGTFQVELTALDGDGMPVAFPGFRGLPIALSPGQTATALVYAQLGQSSSPIKVDLLLDGAPAATRTFDPPFGDDESITTFLSPSQTFILSVGPAFGIDEAIELEGRPELEQTEHVRFDDASRLPKRWYGYDGVDVVVISASRTAPFAGMTPISGEAAALDDWVQRGGRLILLVGAQAPQLLAPQVDPASPEIVDRPEPLARFSPGTFTGPAELRDATAYENYTGATDPVPGERQAIVVPRLEGIDPRLVEAAEGELPLVVRQPRGFGEVTFVAGDLGDAPFVDWKARGQLAARLLSRPSSSGQPFDETKSQGLVGQHGYGDLAGQLRAGLNRFAGVRPVPFWLVALIVCGYLALIGPGDYFLLKFGLKRMELTWLTFSLMVLAASGAAYGLARWLKGDEVRVNQVDVVDFDLAEGTTHGLVRGTTWINLFSPKMDAYSISAEPRRPAGEPIADRELLLSSFGLTNDAAIGIGLSGGDDFSRAYDVSPELDALLGVPIQVWSTKGAVARYTYRADSSGADEMIDADLYGPLGHELDGTLTSGLGEPLEDCFLIYGMPRSESISTTEAWAYELGKLAPGQTVLLGSQASSVPDRLRDILAEEKLVDEGQGRYISEVAPYAAGEPDAALALTQMSVYDATDSQVYTGLANRELAWLDLSSQLAAGRALLIGRAKAPAAAVLRDGRPLAAAAAGGHPVFYRYVLPIQEGPPP